MAGIRAGHFEYPMSILLRLSIFAVAIPSRAAYADSKMAKQIRRRKIIIIGN
jgi:hypothetical protein